MADQFPHISHKAIKGKGGDLKGYRVTPIVRLCAGDGPVIYIQNGQYMGAGGAVLEPEDLPDWLPTELNKLNEVTYKSTGLPPRTKPAASTKK